MNGNSAWYEEFPIAQSEEFRVSRRGFTRACCAAAAAGTLGLGAILVSAGRAHAAEFEAAAVDGFEPGTDRIVIHPESGEPILIVRLPSGEFRAFDQRCSHLMCPVHYDAAKEKIFCPCHHGLFDPKTGAPAGGPPRKPLPHFDVSVREGRIFVGSPGSAEAES